MPGQQGQHDGGLTIGIEVGPVHRHFDVSARSHHVRDPVAKRRIDVDPLIGQQSVHLFDGVFGDQPTSQGETLSDRIDRQGRGADDAEGGIGQG